MLQRHIIAGHSDRRWSIEAQAGGLLTDGMGNGGHNVTRSGQDWAVVRGEPGMMAQLDLRALWIPNNNNVRVYVDGDSEATVLTGTVLPPEVDVGRRFRSKPGGNLSVMLVTDDYDSLSFFSFAVHTPCTDASGCGGHGSCDAIGGTCQCNSGYTGPMCQVNLCHGVDCGSHGSCTAGACECEAGYTGPNCTKPPLPCCSNYCCRGCVIPARPGDCDCCCDRCKGPQLGNCRIC